jgi:hypothetical protein
MATCHPPIGDKPPVTLVAAAGCDGSQTSIYVVGWKQTTLTGYIIALTQKLQPATGTRPLTYSMRWGAGSILTRRVPQYRAMVPAEHHYTSDGLEREWFGFVWLNPPYGRGVLPLWLEKFARHGNGIALVPERTSTAWWQALASRADMILCVNSKIPFADLSGEQTNVIPIGSTLVAIGEKGVRGLIEAHRNGLGILLTPVCLESVR